MHYVNVVLDWIEAHPTFFAVIIMPLIGALVSWLGKPRTPEEFARMPYVLAQLLRVWAAVFPDPVKITKVIGELFSKRVPASDEKSTGKLPPDPPSGAGGLGVLAVAVVISLSTQSCTPSARRGGANTALDVAQMMCVIANAFLDVPSIRTACRIEGLTDDFIRRLIDSARSRAVKGVPACAASGTCKPEEVVAP